MATLQLFCATVAVALTYAAWTFAKELLRRLSSPLNVLSGPAGYTWTTGNFAPMVQGNPALLQEDWVDQYGSTFKIKGFFGLDHLFTIDHRAVNHILTHSFDFQKPPQGREAFSRIVGEGLLIAEADAHRKQRRVMNPGFGPAQIRSLAAVFIEKSMQLRDSWFVEIRNAGGGHRARINALSWLSRTTLDIIGIAGFDYHFNTLNESDTPNELNEAFATMFRGTEELSAWQMLRDRFSLFRIVPNDRERQIAFAQRTMNRIGYELIAEKKAMVRAEKHGAHVARDDVQGRDLLSLLVKANMAVDFPEDQRLSDKDILAQIPTFLVAGHETISTGTTWALFALTQRPDVQSKLRTELLTVPTETPTMDELQSLPYLDAVVRETLRVHAPVLGTTRIATRDDVIPVSEAYEDKNGDTRTEIRIAKGDMVFIPIIAMNQSKRIWGEDAHEFKHVLTCS